MQQELKDADRRSEELLMNLSGHRDNEAALRRLTAEIIFDDPGEYMPQDRLQAWIRLFLEEPIDSGFLVTSSATIFNTLVESLVPNEKMFEIKRLPTLSLNDETLEAWREAFYLQIKNGMESEGEIAENAFTHRPPLPEPVAGFSLTLYRLPGCAPTQLFGRFLKSTNGDPIKLNQTPDIRNTLLGLVERNRSPH